MTERIVDTEIRLIPYYRNDAASLPWYENMKCKYFAAIVFAAMLLLSLTACGKLPFLSKGGQGTFITENMALLQS